MKNFPIDLSPSVFRKEYKEHLNEYQIKLLDFFEQSKSLEIISITAIPMEDKYRRYNHIKCVFRFYGQGIEGSFAFDFKG